MYTRIASDADRIRQQCTRNHWPPGEVPLPYMEGGRVEAGEFSDFSATYSQTPKSESAYQNRNLVHESEKQEHSVSIRALK